MREDPPLAPIAIATLGYLRSGGSTSRRGTSVCAPPGTLRRVSSRGPTVLRLVLTVRVP
jgi:hypothetical protein